VSALAAQSHEVFAVLSGLAAQSHGIFAALEVLGEEAVATGGFSLRVEYTYCPALTGTSLHTIQQ